MRAQNIEIKHLTINDYPDFKDVMISSYPMMPEAYWKEHHIKTLTEIFPEGQIIVRVDGHFAGCALSIIVNYNYFEEQHTYRDITDNYTFNSHTPKEMYFTVLIFLLNPNTGACVLEGECMIIAKIYAKIKPESHCIWRTDTELS
jgi:hypothetical protein